MTAPVQAASAAWPDDELCDAAILREAVRRLKGGGGKGSPSLHGYCEICGQNERYKHNQIIEVLEAIATHAEHSPRRFYGGIYHADA